MKRFQGFGDFVLIKAHSISSRISRMVGIVGYAVVLVSVVFLSSCQLAKNQMTYDRAAGFDRQNFRDALSPAPPPSEADSAAMPDFQPVMSTPEGLKLPSPLVTVSVNQTVSLRELLFELASQADVDLEFDPQIHGSLVFTAKEKPFDQVVDRICEMSGLRYTFENGVLRVELDRPYVKNYSVDYLNITRSSDSSINTSVSISNTGGGSGSTGGGSISGGSESTIDNKYEGDFWTELEENVEQILLASDAYIPLATLADPETSSESSDTAAAAGGGAASTTPPALPGGSAGGGVPTLNVTTPAAEPFTASPPATYSLSKQSGIISIFASERQHKLVSKYLDSFRKRATTQVLIEAKVLQVDLSDEFATGVDWSSFNLTGITRLSGSFAQPAFTPPTATGDGFTAVFQPGSDLKAAIQAISRFGTVRTLSSPRISALNNQPAIVNVARNVVYFQIQNQATTTTDTGVTTTTGGIQATPMSVPEGVLLNVIPQANADTGEISLVIRPTITKITGFVDDPTPKLLLIQNPTANPALAIANQIPVMATQEMDSIVKMQSGQTMVLGGLMKDANTVEEVGVPLAGDIPLIGGLFRNHKDKVEKSELVIFLRTTIIPGSSVDDTDRKLYKSLGMDRRPVRM